MDANSCEFRCADMTIFYVFMNDYLEIYKRMNYAGGTCSYCFMRPALRVSGAKSRFTVCIKP